MQPMLVDPASHREPCGFARALACRAEPVLTLAVEAANCSSPYLLLNRKN